MSKSPGSESSIHWQIEEITSLLERVDLRLTRPVLMKQGVFSLGQIRAWDSLPQINLLGEVDLHKLAKRLKKAARVEIALIASRKPPPLSHSFGGAGDSDEASANGWD
jgi:hypothetical protein